MVTSTKTSNPSPSGGLGVFAKFPPEIRLLIWDEFRPSGWTRHKTDLTILRASRQLNAEITVHLHKCMKVINFVIRPNIEGPEKYPYPGYPDYPSYENIEIWDIGYHGAGAGAGAEPRESAPKWTVTNVEHNISRRFQYLPLHILPAVVWIEPPKNSKSLNYLWRKLRQVEEFLLRMRHPPKKHLTIKFVQSESWIRKRRIEPPAPLSPLPPPLSPGSDFRTSLFYSEMEFLLRLLFHLDSACEVQVHIDVLDELQDHLFSLQLSHARHPLLQLLEINLPD